MKKEQLKYQAQKLRKAGYSYSQIQTKLATTIPKSSLSNWCKSIQITKAGLQKNEKHKNTVRSQAQHAAVIANKSKRNAYLLSLDQNNQGLMNNTFDKDVMKIALGMLYLGEGSKNRSCLTFGNSNPDIISLFLSLLRKTYEIDEKKFRCTVQCRADQDIKKLQNFWSRICKIPIDKFYKAQIDLRTKGRKTINLNYKGVLRIDYLSANVFNDVLSVIKTILMGR